MGKLDGMREVDGKLRKYDVLAVDGSQIYPDRHRAGGEIGLINIGGAHFSYDETSSVRFFSEPELVLPGENLDDIVTPELVDVVREERELEVSLEKSGGLGSPSLVLIDGTLSLGHMASEKLGKRLQGSWVSVFDKFYQRRQPVAATK